MSDTQGLLVFQEFGKGSARERVWLSRCGRVAALLDVSDSQRVELYERAIEVLAESSADAKELTAVALGRRLDEVLGNDASHLQALLLVCTRPSTIQACSRGNLRLLRLARGQAVKDLLPDSNTDAWRSSNIELRVREAHSYVVCSPVLNREALSKQSPQAIAAHHRKAWDAIFDAAAERPDWAALIFPVSSAIGLRLPSWKYDPFEGTQEEQLHERQGLAEVASALFGDAAFDGFRILPAPVMFHRHDDSQYDGLLVSPLGVFLLELKDYAGKTVLHESDRFQQYPAWPQQRSEPRQNVFRKFAVDLKKVDTHAALKRLKGRERGWLAGIGALIFTYPGAQIVQRSAAGEQPATGVGSVVVAQPANLAKRLREKVSATAHGGPERRLSRSEIDEIVKHYLGEERKGKGTGLQIGRYTLGAILDQDDYITTYTATWSSDPDRSPLWVRELRASSLVHAAKGPAAAEALFRANMVLLLKLPADQRLQRAVETLERGAQLYAVVQAVPHPTLAEWLVDSPPRDERRTVLRELAEVLVLLAQNGVTHRALSPRAVRVQPGGIPVLTNFDLCHVNNLATLSAEARSVLDRSYLAPEADRPGSIISTAADVYSFARLLCFVLAGALPFESYLQQSTWARDTNAFPDLAQRCGLEDAVMLKRMLSPAASERPTPAECLAWTKTW